MAKKTKPKLEEKTPEVSEEETLLQTKRALCHPGEASYHIITWLQAIAQELKRGNDLLEQDSEEEETEEEDSDEEEPEED